jgi:hypothetical protein
LDFTHSQTLSMTKHRDWLVKIKKYTRTLSDLQNELVVIDAESASFGLESDTNRK